MTIELESLKDKLAKLLAKAEGTDNPAEADAFMAKVNQLLEQHQIGLHEIRNHGISARDPLGEAPGMNHIPCSLAWYRSACGAIAQYYGCQFVYYKYKNGRVPYKLVGYESARVTTELMMPFIISQVRQAARKYMKEENIRTVDLYGSIAAAKKYGDYLTEVKAQTHVGLALVNRIYRLRAELERQRAADAKAGGATSNALVLVTIADAVEAYMKEKFPKLKTGRSSTGSTTYAAMEHADKISLHTQTEHSKHRMIG